MFLTKISRKKTDRDFDVIFFVFFFRKRQFFRSFFPLTHFSLTWMHSSRCVVSVVTAIADERRCLRLWRWASWNVLIMLIAPQGEKTARRGNNFISHTKFFRIFNPSCTIKQAINQAIQRKYEIWKKFFSSQKSEGKKLIEFKILHVGLRRKSG